MGGKVAGGWFPSFLYSRAHPWDAFLSVAYQSVSASVFFPWIKLLQT